MNKVLIGINGQIFGGAEKMCIALANNLERLGYEPHLLINSKKQKLDFKYPCFFLNFSKFISFLNFIPALIKFLILIRKYDLIIIENKYLLQFVGIIKPFTRKKFIAYVHYPPSPYEIKKCQYLKNNLIILCCEALRSYFPESSKIKILKNFVNIPEITSEDLRENLSIPKDAIIITHAGHFSPVKSQLESIKVFTELQKTYPNIYLILIGEDRSNNQNYIKECKNLANKNIIFTGQVDSIFPYLDISDIYIQPSKKEGLPLVILEAMGSELPIIASDVDGVTEAVKHNKNGYIFSAGDYMQFRNYLADLIENNEKRAVFAKNSIEIFNKNYVETVYKEYLGIRLSEIGF